MRVVRKAGALALLCSGCFSGTFVPGAPNPFDPLPTPSPPREPAPQRCPPLRVELVGPAERWAPLGAEVLVNTTSLVPVAAPCLPPKFSGGLTTAPTGSTALIELTLGTVLRGVRFVPDLPGRYVITFLVEDLTFGPVLNASVEVDVPDAPSLEPLATAGVSCSDLEIWGERTACILDRCADPLICAAHSGTAILVRDGSKLVAAGHIPPVEIAPGVTASPMHGLAAVGDLLATTDALGRVNLLSADDLANPVATATVGGPSAAIVDVAAGPPGFIYAAMSAAELRVLSFDGSSLALSRTIALRLGAGRIKTPVLFGDGVLVTERGDFELLRPADAPAPVLFFSTGFEALAAFSGGRVAGVSERSVSLFSQIAEGGLSPDMAAAFGPFHAVATSPPFIAAAGPGGVLVFRVQGEALVPHAAISGAEVSALAIEGRRLVVSTVDPAEPAAQTSLFELP